MLNAIKKVPAGTFLVPMLTSAFIYTFWPNLFQVGGLTEHIFGGQGRTASLVPSVLLPERVLISRKSVTR